MAQNIIFIFIKKIKERIISIIKYLKLKIFRKEQFIMPIQRTEPIIKVNNTFYKTCSLNFDLLESELFYQFAYSKKNKEKLFNINLQKETGRPDHITWHKNSVIQLSTKGDNIKLGLHKTSESFIPDNNNLITILIIHSVYPINNEYHLPIITTFKKHQKLNGLNFTENKPFSIILFLTPERIDQNDFLKTIFFDTPFGKVSGELLGFTAGRILAWDGWAIDYVLSDLALKLLLNSQPNPYHSAFAYSDLHLIIQDLLTQRIIK